jgi:hypothetical protein
MSGCTSSTAPSGATFARVPAFTRVMRSRPPSRPMRTRCVPFTPSPTTASQPCWAGSAAIESTLNAGPPPTASPTASACALIGAARLSTCCVRSAMNCCHSSSIILPVTPQGALCRRGTMLPLYCSTSPPMALGP